MDDRQFAALILHLRVMIGLIGFIAGLLIALLFFGK
jgi:hypothetical protein